MNSRNWISAIFLLACCGLLAGCPNSQEEDTEKPITPEEPITSEKPADVANGPEKPVPPPPPKHCRAKDTFVGIPDFVDREFGFKEPPSAAVHLKKGQTMHIKGPQDDTYVLTPLTSTGTNPPHNWPVLVDHVATLADPMVENEYCVRTEVTEDGHTNPAAHRFLFRVIGNDPAEFCIQKPEGNQCGGIATNAHVEAAHGGSASLF